MEEIINRVTNSKLITFDLEDHYPKGKRVLFDIKDWLLEKIVLKETDFRNYVKNHDWSQYQDNYIALTCSADAIIPSWAYLLVAAELSAFAKKTVVGDLDLLETVIFSEVIKTLDVSNFKDRLVIIKGCSEKSIPSSAYTLLINKLQPIVKSLMFGEACSTVPLYKAKK